LEWGNRRGRKATKFDAMERKVIRLLLDKLWGAVVVEKFLDGVIQHMHHLGGAEGDAVWTVCRRGAGQSRWAEREAQSARGDQGRRRSSSWTVWLVKERFEVEMRSVSSLYVHRWCISCWKLIFPLAWFVAPCSWSLMIGASKDLRSVLPV
jgi:hypothetical protein